jgi:hypothetical protein
MGKLEESKKILIKDVAGAVLAGGNQEGSEATKDFSNSTIKPCLKLCAKS